MQAILSKKRLLWKWLLLLVLGVFCCLIEQTWYALGTQTQLFLLPIPIAIVGLYYGMVPAAYYGIFCGLLADAAGGGQIYLLPVIYMLYGLLAGICGQHVYKHGWLAFGGFSCAAAVLHSGYLTADAWVGSGFQTNVMTGAVKRLPLDLIWSFLIGTICALPIMICAASQNRRKRVHR